MQYLTNILEAIKDMIQEAGKNPFSLIAYLVLVIAAFFIAFKICEYQVLLKNIQKLPMKDRLKALKEVSNKIKLKEGLSGDQWIKTRCYNFIFYGFLIFLATGTIIFILYASGFFGNVYGILSLSKPSEDSFDNSYLEDSDFFVTYKEKPIEKSEDKALYITHEFNYLTRLNNQSVVNGVPFPPKFILQEPDININVINNSNKIVTIDDVLFEITENELSTNPVPIFTFANDEYFVSRLINIGSGTMFNTIVKSAIFINSDCSDFSADTGISETTLLEHACDHNKNYDAQCNMTGKIFTQNIGKMNNFFPIEINAVVPELYKNNSIFFQNNHDYVTQNYPEFLGLCCLAGVLSYSDANNIQHNIPFKSQVTTGGIVDYIDDTPALKNNLVLNLKAGEAGEKRLIHVGQAVNPRNPQNINFKVVMDKSAQVTIQISLITSEGKSLPVGKVVLDYFKPKESTFH